MPSSSTIRLREARKEDIPSLVPMLLKAFRGRAMNEAFFPERLRVNEGDVDQLAFRTYGIEQRFAVRDEAQGGGDPPETQHKRYHYLVAVEDGGSGPGDDDDDGAAETIVGYAEWVDMTPTEKTEEELAKDKERQAQLAAERKARRPPSLDIEAVDAAYESIAVLEGFLKKALGEEGFANSWCLDAIGVDPDQQRKGIGRLLMQYGAERAERDGKNIRFMASENGAKLYRALGYEEVGSCEILGGMEYSFVKRAKM